MGRPRCYCSTSPRWAEALVIKQTFEVIRRINQVGTTVLLAEQNAFAALKIAHRAYVIKYRLRAVLTLYTSLNQRSRLIAYY